MKLFIILILSVSLSLGMPCPSVGSDTVSPAPFYGGAERCDVQGIDPYYFGQLSQEDMITVLIMAVVIAVVCANINGDM